MLMTLAVGLKPELNKHTNTATCTQLCDQTSRHLPIQMRRYAGDGSGNRLLSGVSGGQLAAQCLYASKSILHGGVRQFRCASEHHWDTSTAVPSVPGFRYKPLKSRRR